MFLRSADDGPEHPDGKGIPPRPRGTPRLPAERVRVIRQRIADDAYRSADVVNEIALRILVSRDL
jgi:hypothetical protein